MCMARPRGNWTLDKNSIDYLKQFPNQSKVLDEAIELHRNKDKKVSNIPRAKILEVNHVRN